MPSTAPTTARNEAVRRPWRALVPDGDQVIALEVCRCLSRAGMQVAMLAENPATLHLGTRHACRRVVVAPGETGSRLADLAREMAVDVIVPATLEGFKRVAAARDSGQSLPPVIAMSDWATLQRANDKAEFAEHAQRSGLSVPMTVVFDPRFDDAETFDRSALRFPVLLKPAIGTRSEGIRLVRNESEWCEVASSVMTGSGRWVVQNFIEGNDVDCSVYCREGEILVWTIQRGLVDELSGVGGGLGVEFVEDAAVLAVVRETMASLRFNGVAHCDLRYDTAGRVSLLEVNPRFWGSLAASTAAGVNFAALAVRDAVGEPWSAPGFRPCRYHFTREALPRMLKSPRDAWANRHWLWQSDLGARLRDPAPDLKRLWLWIRNQWRGSAVN